MPKAVLTSKFTASNRRITTHKKAKVQIAEKLGVLIWPTTLIVARQVMAQARSMINETVLDNSMGKAS
jgi:hypothetical protein